jgi:F420-0:gamma-glutamyl ligase
VAAFKMAQGKNPGIEREKVTGFVLLIGAGHELIEAGEDREIAVNKAVRILEERDTVVVVSKLQSKFGNSFVTKDQLILTRKTEKEDI